MKNYLHINGFANHFFPEIAQKVVDILAKSGYEFVPSTEARPNAAIFRTGNKEKAKEEDVHFMRLFSEKNFILTFDASLPIYARRYFTENFEVSQWVNKSKEVLKQYFEIAEFLHLALGQQLTFKLPENCKKLVLVLPFLDERYSEANQSLIEMLEDNRLLFQTLYCHPVLSEMPAADYFNDLQAALANQNERTCFVFNDLSLLFHHRAFAKKQGISNWEMCHFAELAV